MDIYPKNSMDRFGDDLTELILQYMTFEDKVRLECVSKQWRRLVFNKQFAIELDFSLYDIEKPFNRLKDLRLLKTLLKKCPNIMKVNLNPVLRSEVKLQMLSLIGRYCPRLKSLGYYVYTIDDKSLDFFRMYGHKLEELDLNGSDDGIKQILKLCPNVKKVRVLEFSLLFNEDKEFLPKLEHIFSKFLISSEYVNKMKILSDKYSQTMKTLRVWLRYMSAEELKTCIDCISRFQNLRQLKLTIETNFKESIDNCLSLIGQRCSKLLKLDLEVSGLFKFPGKLSVSVECFKLCD